MNKKSKLKNLIERMVRSEVRRQVLNENSTKIEYRGRTYWVDSNDLDDRENSKVFAYTDEDLKNVAKVNGKTLMFPIKDIEDKLIK